MDSNLKLDDNHDIIIGRQAARTSGLEYTAQLVKCRLLTFMGEWALDRALGVPWAGVLERSYDISALKFAIQNTIQTTNGVKSLDSLELKANPDTRLLSVKFSATSIYGKIGLEVTV